MLADDPLGSARERLEDPLPPSYLQAFEALEHASHIQLVVAEDEDGAVIGCLQLCILPGLSLAGRLARPNRRCSRRHALPQPRRRRKIVQWAVAEARAKGCKLVELLTHNSRVDAQRFYVRLGFAPSHVGMTLRF